MPGYIRNVVVGQPIEIEALSVSELRPVTATAAAGKSSVDQQAHQQQVQAILDQAHREAGEIVAAAREQAIAELDQARRLGHQEGLLRGQKEGRQAATEQLDTLRELLAGVQDTLARLFEQEEARLIDLAWRIAERVVASRIDRGDEVIQGVIREAIDTFRRRELLVVKVHPDDLELARNLQPELLAAFDDIEDLQVVPDERVDRGGCMIETPHGRIDGRIRTRLAECRQQLLPEGGPA